MSTAFDIESLNFLHKIGQRRFKIPSGEITNLPYLRAVARFNKEIILSTGMSSLKEVKTAVKILVKNKINIKKITVLHCNSAYPTPFKDVNLNVMKIMEKKLSVKIGYSDHTIGIETPIAAVALGANIIEKHFSLNVNQTGPDHKVSLSPNDFKKMILCIRNIELAKGKKIKRITNSEKENIKLARRSLVAKNNINKGDIFSNKNITCKRPALGISPMKIDNYIGKKAKKNYKINSFIRE